MTIAKYIALETTGQTGTAMTNALIRHVVVRDESKGAAWKAQGTEVAIIEDIADVDTWARAFEGVVGDILNPPDYSSSNLLAQTEQVISVVAEAAQRMHFSKIVALSSIGGHLC